MDVYDENGALTPTLTTARLVLRPYRASDVDAVVEILNDWNVTRWLTAVPYPYGAADFHWFLTTFIPQTQHVVWAIEAGERLIGAVSVRSELGYWLAPDHHGQGLMTEAAGAACDWHFRQGAEALTSGYMLGNGPSCAILTKLGFRNTQIDRRVTTARGETVDIQRMALTRADWLVRDV